MEMASMIQDDRYYFDFTGLDISLDENTKHSIDLIEEEVTEKGYSHIAREFIGDGVKLRFTNPDTYEQIIVDGVK